MPKHPFRGKSFPISVESVITIVKMLIETKQTDKFIQVCKEAEATVTIPAKTANPLKDFIENDKSKSVRSLAAHPVAASVVGLKQADCQDFECPHIHR